MEDLGVLSRALKEKFGGKIVDVIVFGSYVRGDHGEESDIDILVVVNDEKIERDVRKTIYSFIPKFGRLISVKVVEKNVFDIMKNFSFMRTVIK